MVVKQSHSQTDMTSASSSSSSCSCSRRGPLRHSWPVQDCENSHDAGTWARNKSYMFTYLTCHFGDWSFQAFHCTKQLNWQQLRRKKTQKLTLKHVKKEKHAMHTHKKTQTSRPQFTVITAHTTVLMTAQLQHTIQQGTVLVIFPLILQSPPLCWRKWGETAWQHTHSFEFLFASSFLIVFFLFRLAMGRVMRLIQIKMMVTAA